MSDMIPRPSVGLPALPPDVDRTRLDDVIRYDAEHTTLDFKRTQYAQEQHEALLKDVQAMANAHATGDRLIVCGVYRASDGERTLLGVTRESFPDAATYQELVHQNIEPDLHLDYFPYEVDGVLLAVFRIKGCTERPYAMRKRYGRLEHGHLWIRKGTHQMPMRREDLERIYAERAAAARFSGVVRLGFDAPGMPTTITLPAAAEIVLPSDRAARKIQSILDARAVAARQRERLGIAGAFPGEDVLRGIRNIPSIYGPMPYEQRDTKTLQANLLAVKDTYEIEDEYEFTELYSHKVNLVLEHQGTEHVEAARLELEIPATPGVTVATNQASRPSYGLHGGVQRGPVLRGRGERGYPEVRQGRGGANVSDELGDLRHQSRIRAFVVPLRLVLRREAVGATIPVACTLHGKNLRQPIRSTLTLVVGEPDGSLPVDDEER